MTAVDARAAPSPFTSELVARAGGFQPRASRYRDGRPPARGGGERVSRRPASPTLAMTVTFAEAPDGGTILAREAGRGDRLAVEGSRAERGISRLVGLPGHRTETTKAFGVMRLSWKACIFGCAEQSPKQMPRRRAERDPCGASLLEGPHRASSVDSGTAIKPGGGVVSLPGVTMIGAGSDSSILAGPMRPQSKRNRSS